MKYKIEFYEVEHGTSNIFAVPDQLYDVKYIETDSEEELVKYVTGLVDRYGKFYKDEPFSSFGLDFRFTTGNGGVKVKVYEPYVEPRFEKI